MVRALAFLQVMTHNFQFLMLTFEEKSPGMLPSVLTAMPGMETEPTLGYILALQYHKELGQQPSPSKQPHAHWDL